MSAVIHFDFAAGLDANADICTLITSGKNHEVTLTFTEGALDGAAPWVGICPTGTANVLARGTAEGMADNTGDCWYRCSREVDDSGVMTVTWEAENLPLPGNYDMVLCPRDDAHGGCRVEGAVDPIGRIPVQIRS